MIRQNIQLIGRLTMDASKDKDDTTAFLEKMDAKKEAKKAKQVDSVPKKLILERDQFGLYYVRYDGGGQLPETLKGMFNSIHKLRSLIAHSGKELVE